jgi:predicted O-linked N-acetylglucosamine transferase (SPINDLY family)
LNRFSKVSAGVLELWARILHAVPGSRLLLKDPVFDTASQRTVVQQTLNGHGIEAERIKLVGGSSQKEHLAALNEVDIALDPFPQNGGTSTWEALWMGVPVVAKLGNSVPSRISAAILGAIGLADWTAADEHGYAELAVEKAADPVALAQLRTEIRRAISASPAGNSLLYTRAVEDAYRAVWHRWCESKSTP